MRLGMRLGRTLAASAVGLGAVLALSGCGREADKASRPEALAASLPGQDAGEVRSSRRAERTESRRERGGAELIWASSRQRTAEESAQRQFDRNGADFGARSVEDYAAKARAFVSAPPKGAQTIQRNNGDVLYYDAKANVFAVADKDGVPKALFKPRDGQAYWTQQKQRLADDRSSGRRSSRGRSAGGDDANG